MACTKCKHKKNYNQDFFKKSEFVGRNIIWFFIVWSLLALYGIYNLILNL